MNDEPTPRPAEVAHAVLDEITAQVQARTAPSGNGRVLHWLLPTLSALVAASALLGALGRMLYASRDEYTTAETANVVAHTKLTEALVRVDKTLEVQTQAMTKMSEALQAQALQLARYTAREKK